jgi:nucleoside-diphosphate-sugar epimerase
LELCRELHLPLIYASSAAVYGPDQGRPLGESEGVAPQTLYGVFKRTNEEMARVYNLEYGVRSAGFRPYVVYGPGRDQGMTSDVTTAIVRAAQGEPFRIRFGGMLALQHAEDAALAFVRAALAPPADARIYNLRGKVVDVSEVVRVVEAVTDTRGLITWDASPLPIAADLSDRAFQKDYGPFDYRDLEQGMLETLEVLRAGRHP